MEETDLTQLEDLLEQYDGIGSEAFMSTTTSGDVGWFAGYAAAMGTWWTWTIMVIVAASMWMIFDKAGKPGWAAVIPVYNFWVLLEVIKKPWWWILLMLIPIVNLVVAIVATRETARVFGQGVAFTIGLIFLPFIFYPILALGKEYKYKG
jgi:hypothetical protein